MYDDCHDFLKAWKATVRESFRTPKIHLEGVPLSQTS
jgi:hypothetical protein